MSAGDNPNDTTAASSAPCGDIPSLVLNLELHVSKVFIPFTSELEKLVLIEFDDKYQTSFKKNLILYDHHKSKLTEVLTDFTRFLCHIIKVLTSQTQKLDFEEKFAADLEKTILSIQSEQDAIHLAVLALRCDFGQIRKHFSAEMADNAFFSGTLPTFFENIPEKLLTSNDVKVMKISTEIYNLTQDFLKCVQGDIDNDELILRFRKFLETIDSIIEQSLLVDEVNALIKVKNQIQDIRDRIRYPLTPFAQHLATILKQSLTHLLDLVNEFLAKHCRSAPNTPQRASSSTPTTPLKSSSEEISSHSPPPEF